MRIVITGGPSVGKTTIISLLEAGGFTVVHEQATQIIKEGVFLPWVDRAKFQAEVLRRQMKAEAAVPENGKPVFLDRGLFDGEAYYLYDRLPVPAAFAELDASRYKMAFLIEELPFFENNEVRRENLEFTRQISLVLENCYTRRNVPVVRVPALPPAERVAFVLARVQEMVVEPPFVRGPASPAFVSNLASA
ncbi:MAG TPA: ATP-binding protein [Candidatus Obscuribacterales bacterium]